MAQGKGLKGKVLIKPRNPSATNKNAKSATVQQRKGRVVKATKNAKLVKHDKLQKKLVAGMTASLEQAMAVKAGAVGKLTIMKEAQEKGKTVKVKRRKY
ncbi:hypothetical protein J3B02_003630 [Coemansia erecta]|uniref:Uncharacterized protein n=1 Tax=Coemansia asiatica TaxID=1052880 RepID=A0A9W7XIY4_9FUNG|nr:hypothetical protein LPJ64_004501 [Coemansia asiatica]KAJ2850821.1 hypothetical protein J3B02_003630 [Coemansia erecta]